MAGNRFRQIIEVVMKGAGKTASDAKKVQKGLQGVAKDAAKIGAAFYAAKGGINAMQNFSNSALAIENLTPAFDNLRKSMGFSSDTLNKLNTALNGTVKQADLMRIANQAMTLGVVDSEQGFAELFDTAQRLGKSLGVDTLHAIDSLVTGMGRQSIMMLDNLGIIVDSNKAYEDYAETIGKTSSQLTDQEKKIAFNNAALESAKDKVSVLGDENLTAADSFAQLSRASNDFGAGIGALVMPVLDGAASLAASLITELNELLGFKDSAQGDDIGGSNERLNRRMLLIKGMSDTDEKRLEMQKFINTSLQLENYNIDANNLSMTEFTRLTSLAANVQTSYATALSDANKEIRKQQGLPYDKQERLEQATEAMGMAFENIDYQTARLQLQDYIVNVVLATQQEEKNAEMIANLAQIYKVDLVTGIGETATAYQQWVDDLQATEDSKNQELDWVKQLSEENYELAVSAGLVADATKSYGELFNEFAESQMANLEQQQLQQDMIDNFIVLYPEQAEALGLVHSRLKEETEMYEEEAEAQKKANDERKEAIALMKQQVNMAMALGASHINAGQAALEASGVYITAKIQEIVADYIATAFGETGFFGGLAAVATGAAFGSLVGQTVQSVGKMKFAAEGMNEVVTEPTLIMAGEEGAEYVNIEPTQNEGAGMGNGSQIIFQGNVLSKDFIEDEAIPMIREALRRGHSLS